MGSIAFLLYFKFFDIPLNADYDAMITRIPAFLAIITVPICSFISFFTTSKVIFTKFEPFPNKRRVYQIAAFSVSFTVLMDLVITVLIQKIDILLFPINLMYLFAWLIIIPGIVLAGNKKKKLDNNF